MENNNTIGDQEESQLMVELESANQTPIDATPLPCFGSVTEEDFSYTDVAVPSLKTMIKKAIEEAKTRIKQASVGEMAKRVIPLRLPERRIERTTTFAGQEHIVFVIPPELPLSIDELDKLASYEVDGEDEVGYQFSLSERIDGWVLERLQRIDKRFDLFFLHPKSQKKFRSISEVENFILYNKYRGRRGAEKDQSNESQGQQSGSTKRKRVAPSCRKHNNSTIKDTSISDNCSTQGSEEEPIESLESKRRSMVSEVNNPEIREDCGVHEP